MALQHLASASGELEGLVQSTGNLFGGMADKLWPAKNKNQEKRAEIGKVGALNSESFDSNFKKDIKTFEDLDLLESGHAREYITEECLLPCPTVKKWSTCNVIKNGKSTFRMYLDEAQPRFVLSAKRVGDSFFISQYESFPESINGVPEVSSCAVLRTCSEGYFKLFLNGCEACDKKADKYTCGSGHSFDNRQLLAEINHSVKRVKEANADMRCLSVKLPEVYEDQQTRDVWCPRMEQARKSNNAELKTRHFRLHNKLPEWNEALQSLVLRFNKGRVLAPSAKNFLICLDGQDNGEGVLQFGKTRKRRYALDFRHPVSPLQAFGICLSFFNWNV